VELQEYCHDLCLRRKEHQKVQIPFRTIKEFLEKSVNGWETSSYPWYPVAVVWESLGSTRLHLRGKTIYCQIRHGFLAQIVVQIGYLEV